MAEAAPIDLPGVLVTVDFVRHRNVLLVQADCAPLLVDHCLHLADHGLRLEPGLAGRFQEALVVFTLHCAARPQAEHLAWTLNFQAPRVALFLAGDNEDFRVTGRVLTEGLREADKNLFYSESLARRGAEKRRSVVEFTGAGAVGAFEAFQAMSEQRRARHFHLGDDRHALLLSHPDCDEAWLAGVDAAAVAALAAPESGETLTRIDERRYQWGCGCTQAKLLRALAPAARADLEGLFGDEQVIRVPCPRCAAGHVLTREAMEACLAEVAADGA